MDLKEIRESLQSDRKRHSNHKKNKISLTCDRCKKRFSMTVEMYTRTIDLDGVPICQKCLLVNTKWSSNRPRKNSGINASYFPSSTSSKNAIQKKQRRFS